MNRKSLIIAFLLSFWMTLLHAQDSPDMQIEIEIKTNTLKDVLREIEEKTTFQFAYNANKIDGKSSISIKGKNTLKTTLEIIKQQLNLEYSMIRNTIVLTENPRPSKEKGKVTIFGHIREKESGENLYGATVYDSISQTGAVSNHYGYFSLTIPKGPTNILVSYLGSTSQWIALDLDSDTLVEIRQEISSQELNSVIVTGESEGVDRGIGTMVLSQKQLTERPAVGGEVDPIKVLQLLPGVQAGNEGSAGLYIRGGSRSKFDIT